MIFRNLIFEPEVVKQRLRAGMVSHHEQQASKCNGEQQHRELWPAYNLNIAPPQASTEGLFQQTQVITQLPSHTRIAFTLHYLAQARSFLITHLRLKVVRAPNKTHHTKGAAPIHNATFMRSGRI